MMSIVLYQFMLEIIGEYINRSKARFNVAVVTQINKFAVYFTVRRNVKFWCTEC